MTGKYSDAQRREYLELIGRVSRVWLNVFENNRQFYSTDYWDLLSRMWQAGAPVRKTDALNFMIAIKSTHTAGKYLDTAMRHGYIIETENPSDARSKLVDLSSDMRPRLDEFFDIAVDEVLSASDAMKPPDTS
jgi:hypothetical protein